VLLEIAGHHSDVCSSGFRGRALFGRQSDLLFSLLVFVRCIAPLFTTDTVLVLLGVPARPMFVKMHANSNGELLGRPLT
jgi:hypothetical protein